MFFCIIILAMTSEIFPIRKSEEKQWQSKSKANAKWRQRKAKAEQTQNKSKAKQSKAKQRHSEGKTKAEQMQSEERRPRLRKMEAQDNPSQPPQVFWAIWGSSWDHFLSSLSYVSILGVCLNKFAAIMAQLGPIVHQSLGQLGTFLGQLGAILGYPGPSWAILGES
jgi:hypothetical protein